MGKKTKVQWTRDDEYREGIVHTAERRTWADQKKDSKRISALGLALSKLKPEKLDQLNLPEDVREVLDEAFRLRNKGRAKGGLRRHMLRVTSVIREQTPEVKEQMFKDASALLNYPF